jgi:hypothetical protein
MRPISDRALFCGAAGFGATTEPLEQAARNANAAAALNAWIEVGIRMRMVPLDCNREMASVLCFGGDRILWKAQALGYLELFAYATVEGRDKKGQP